MMFATRRSLSDACNSISKQLENVYSSIAVSTILLTNSFQFKFVMYSVFYIIVFLMQRTFKIWLYGGFLCFQAAKRKLSSQIDGLDHGLDDCLETTTRTQEEVGSEILLVYLMPKKKLYVCPVLH